MSRKIFHSIWLVALGVFVASLVFIMGATYTYFSEIQRCQLKLETQLAAQGVRLSGRDYLLGLNSCEYRITWISQDGLVLFDNEAHSSEMENHLEREEVREALQTGFGQSSRYSHTLSEKLLYAAQRLPDGTIIRLSGVQNTLWSLILSFSHTIFLIACLTLVVSFVLASRLSKKIVAPINSIDPEQLESYLGLAEYEEIGPLLHRMSMQQAEIKRNQNELERTSQIRQEFTANVSHELKTPLHIISGYAELLESGMVKQEDIRPFAGKIHQEVQRMTQLVSDIIDLTKLDGGADWMEWEDTDLKLIVDNVVDSLQMIAEEKDVCISVKGTSAVVHGIAQVLHSIVYNLCDNAIKYNHPAGRVVITVEERANAVLLNVQDTGIGIPEKYLNRIFERFYRVDKSHSKEVGGTGLGLSIVKHGVLIHSGEVCVKSDKNGTKFTVTFPKKCISN